MYAGILSTLSKSYEFHGLLMVAKRSRYGDGYISCAQFFFWSVFFSTEWTKPGHTHFFDFDFAWGLFLNVSGSWEQRRGALHPGCQQPTPLELAAVRPRGSISGTEEPGSHPGRLGGFPPFACCYWVTALISSLPFMSCNKIARSEKSSQLLFFSCPSF